MGKGNRVDEALLLLENGNRVVDAWLLMGKGITWLLTGKGNRDDDVWLLLRKRGVGRFSIVGTTLSDVDGDISRLQKWQKWQQLVRPVEFPS